jgi:hypothetical protein
MQKIFVSLCALVVLCLAGCRAAYQPSSVPSGSNSQDSSSNAHSWKDSTSQEARALNRDLLPIEVGGKWGYAGRDGAIKITPQYDSAYFFTFDLAEVCVGECEYPKNGKHGLINTAGQFIVNPTYDNIGDTSSELIPVCIGKCDFDGSSSKWGFVDRKGAVVIPPQFGAAWGFREGLAAVCVGVKCGYTDPNGKWGFIDKTGRFVINPQYDQVTAVSDGVAQIKIGTGKEAKIGYVDKNGKVIYNPTN